MEELMSTEMHAEIQKKIKGFSYNKKYDELEKYLEKVITEEQVTIEQVFNYAKGMFWKDKNKTWVIPASAANSIGLFLAKHTDTQKKQLKGQFYKLAADRDNSWGCSNYAYSIFNENQPEALQYAEKAIELEKNEKTRETYNKHKGTFGRLLLWAGKHKKGILILVEYFEFYIKQYSSTFDKVKKEKVLKEVSPKIEALQEVLDEKLFPVLEENEEVETEYAKSLIAMLKPLINLAGLATFGEGSKAVLAQACYLTGLCYESLGSYPEAMHAFCHSVIDKTHGCYREVISKRAQLLKDQVSRSLTPEDPEDAPRKKQRKSMGLLLHKGVRFLDKFSSFWCNESSWVDSTDARAVESEYELRAKQLNDIIKGREIEIELITELLEGDAKEEEAVQRKKILEEELLTLKEAKESLEKKHSKYHPEKRKIFRRYATEQSFFNPARSKKHAQLIALTHSIIDQRFKLEPQEGDELPPPVDLSQVNSRQLISAERAFQEAAVALTGEENPKLGIPLIREQQWEFDRASGSNGYGPKERYLIADTEVLSEHRTNPKRNRLGDSFLPEHGTYSSDIYVFFLKLAEGRSKKEKKLARFLIRYGKTHQPVTLEELQTVNQSAELADVKKFNQICFLVMEKEQSQWHCAVDSSYQLGMAVAQARALIMVEARFISFEEIFEKNSLFGVYSKTGILKKPKEVEDSCRRIDEMYLAFLQNKNLRKHFSFHKKHLDNPKTYVLTREQAHNDLKEVYGGESDTDESDNEYESDLSFTM